ncbi:hypothetical protein [Aquabacterium sp.]|uniref:hypothetical protein n=1 Tax=Aquabacterium sp. TaxID=1872578 RepID=UPI0035C6E788
MSASINLEIFAGETIEHACAEAVRLADMLGVVAKFDFNGVNVMAKPGVCPKSLAEAWHVELRSDRTIKIACVHPLAAQAKEGGA